MQALTLCMLGNLKLVSSFILKYENKKSENTVTMVTVSNSLSATVLGKALLFIAWGFPFSLVFQA